MKNYFFLFLSFLCISLNAQIKQNIRVEYDEEIADNFDVYAFEKERVALVKYTTKNPKNRKEQMFVFESLDENLKKQKSTQIVIEKDYRAYTSLVGADAYYILAHNYKKGNFKLYSINPATLEVKETKGNFGAKSYIWDWSVEGNYLYASASSKKKLLVLMANISTGKVTTVLPQTKTEYKLTFVDLEKVKTSSGFEMAFQYKVKISKKEQQTYMLRFNENAEQVGKFLILPKPEAETHLLTSTLTKVADDNYILTGTYSKGKRPGSANGIYFASLSESGLKFIKYYNFLDIKNFTSYLSEKKQEKIEKKKAKKEDKGEELNLNYNCTIHDIVDLGGKYVFLGEFYYATYRTVTYTTYVNGRPVVQTRQEFDGYQYTHSALAIFNADGSMDWSNAFEMWLSNKPFYVKQFIRMSTTDSEVKLMFVNGSNIQAVAYNHKGSVVKSKTTEVVSTNQSGDKVKYTVESDLDFWFDNNYITSGFQKIKNNEKEGEDKKRRVYYINKLTF